MSAGRSLRKVSVCLLSWNGREHLETCLPALRAQEDPGVPWEVLLLDNGSDDGTAAWVRREHPWVRLFESRVNTGFCAGNNRLAREAGGDAVAFLNNDTRPAPGWLAGLTRALRAAPDDVAAVSGEILDWQGRRLDFGRGVMTFDGHAFQLDHGRPVKAARLVKEGGEILFPCGGNMIVRKASFQRAGGFDEDYFAYLEDLDLGLRGQLAGWKCWYVPGARVRHHKSVSAGNYSKFKAYHVERNRIWNAVKLMPRFIVFMSPLFTLNRYLMQAYAAATHRGLSEEFVKEYSWLGALRILMRAYAVALWRLPRMLKRRRHITRTRKLTTQQWYELISRYKLDAIELALKY